jgi:hypothetical protein
MRLAVIVPLQDWSPPVVAGLRQLQDWRRRGHKLIAVDGGPRTAAAARAQYLALCDRVVDAPRHWPMQANAGNRAPEAEQADALLFVPAGVLLPAAADRSIARALSNAASPWGFLDLRWAAPAGHPRGLDRFALALANLGRRFTGPRIREHVVFMRRSVFVAMEGFCADDPAADAEFCRRARSLGAPIIVREAAGA